MFPPMTTTTERARIENEARERDARTAREPQQAEQARERSARASLTEQIGQLLKGAAHGSTAKTSPQA